MDSWIGLRELTPVGWKAIERGVRHGLARAVLVPLASRRGPADRVDPGAVRRILFVRPNFRMGNLLLVTPGLSVARRALPGAQIHLLTTPAYDDLVRNHPDVDRVVTFERGMLLRPWSLVGLIRRLREGRYDLVIDCSEGESLTGALLARVSGGRWRVTERPGRYESLFHVGIPRNPGLHHRVERLLHVLAGVGIVVDDPPGVSIGLHAREREWAAARWREEGLPDGGEVVGVNIGARGAKRWPMESFLRVVRILVEESGVRVVVFAGPEDLDRLELAEGRLPDDVVVDTTHQVRRFAALLERCSVLITGDTGPMHLGAAVGTPTVSIFLKGDPRVFAPLGDRHRRLGGESGAPTPDEVVDAAVPGGGRAGSPRVTRGFPSVTAPRQRGHHPGGCARVAPTNIFDPSTRARVRRPRQGSGTSVNLRLNVRHLLKRLLTPVTLRVRGGPLEGLRWSPASGSRFIRGDYEAYNLPAFLEAVGEGDVVFDVGAHVGYFTAIASLRVGPEGRVVAFEPRPVNLALLRRHVEANDLNNVTVVDAGVGRGSGDARFEEGRGSGTGKIADDGGLTIRVVSLDDVVGEDGLPEPDFVKIDVEGGEMDVLEGARGLLERARPRLLVGIHGHEMRERCAALLDELGYQWRTLRPADAAGNTDVLALPSGTP